MRQYNQLKCGYYVFSIFTESSNTERYINISVNMTWFEAQSYCRTHHTDLASTTNAEEYSIMRGFFPDQTWIGLFRDSWKWIDKTNFSTVKWMDDKPDNKLWNENCGYLNKSQAGDAKCSDVMPFFCYASEFKFYSVSYLYRFKLLLYGKLKCLFMFVLVCAFAFLHPGIPGQKQIVRVKIQTNQDVKDTDVKAAILDQVGLILDETSLIFPLLVTAAVKLLSPRPALTHTQEIRVSTLHYLVMKHLFCSSDQAEAEGSWNGREHHREMERATRWNGVS